MGADPRNQGAHRQRLAPPGVTPLEIWDLLTPAGPLHRCSALPHYPHLLAETLDALRGGSARRASGETVAASFQAVAVAGGGLLDPAIPDALRSRFGASLSLLPDPVFAAGAGGRALLQRQGRSGLVVDVGQTAIKVVSRSRRFLYPRDWQVLPPAEQVPPKDYPRQRIALRSFVAAALLRHSRPLPSGVVLALPCDFPGGLPGACSYAGLEGDTFVEEVLAQAGLADVPCVYLNDTVLAALSVRELFGDRLPLLTLVVTLGFGVGGALLEGKGHDAL